MKKGIFFVGCALSLLLTGCAAERLYIGGSDGIHQAQYITNGLPFGRSWMVQKLVADTPVSYMAVKGRALYAARRLAKGVFCVETFRIRRNGLLRKMDAFVIPGRYGYCHISVSLDGRFLLGSSYSGGFIDQLSLVPEGGVVRLKKRFHFSGSSIHRRQKKSHPHFAAQTPDGTMVLAADLGGDRIHVFKCDSRKGLLRQKSVPLPPGSGPRHLSFSADGRFVFAANELNNTVCSFKMEKGKLSLVSTCSLLPEAWSGTSYAGAVRTAPDGKIYVTNRGHNSVAVLSVSSEGKLKLESTFSSEGNFPYDLLFYKESMFLVNMKSDQFSIWEKKSTWAKELNFTIRRPMCIAAPEI